ncbi:MAG: hypothetical protein Q9201_000422 [Fulgogasparrea decipioides]
MASSTNVVKLSDIPTVSQLYKTKDLEPPAGNDSSFSPSAILNSKVALIRTSITDLEVTSIVNAANSSLLGGGGVDGAIHAAAGPELLAECQTLNGCKTGSAKITAAYRLPSQYIIHAVGPVYAREKRKQDGLQAELLANCYRTSLKLAAEKGGSLAFSCLSTGVYGYPSDEAAEVACETVRAFLESEAGQRLERVVFCCFLEKDEKEYEEYLPIVFPPTKDELVSKTPEPDEPAQVLESPKNSEAEALPTPATGVPEDENWVTVKKAEVMAESQGIPVTEEKTAEKPFSSNDVQNTAGMRSKQVNDESEQNRLLKDW